MKPRHDALIFDADGTLVDSEAPGLEVIRQLAVARGLALDSAEAQQRFRGLRMADVAAWIAAQLGEPPDAFTERFIPAVRQAQAAHFQSAGLRAMPGAHALLQRLRQPFCVATNGPREKVSQTLALCGLDALLGERVYCAYEVGSFKPEPGLFLHAARALGVAPAGCAVVEDSLPGIQAGLAAGMTVYALLPPEQAPPAWHGHVRFIDSLVQLDQLLHG